MRSGISYVIFDSVAPLESISDCLQIHTRDPNLRDFCEVRDR